MMNTMSSICLLKMIKNDFEHGIALRSIPFTTSGIVLIDFDIGISSWT